MNTKRFKASIFLLLFMAATSLAQAVTLSEWQSLSFLGSLREDVIKALGQPDDADQANQMDSYMVSDSPDLMMLGMLGYKDNKVSSIFVVCQPSITYTQARDMQVKNEALKIVTEDSRGILFEYTIPQPTGARFMSISHADDKAMGPMLCESIENPFEDGSESAPQAAAKPENKPAKPAAAAKLDTSVMIYDIFDWNAPDEKGNPKSDSEKLAIIKRIKQLWRAAGAETDKNDMPAEKILKNMQFYDQAIIFDVACKAAGIDPLPFWEIRNREEQ